MFVKSMDKTQNNMDRSSKAQSSLEQLLTLGISLTFITAIFYFAFNFASDSTRVAQAQDTINKLGKSADYVYALGPLSKSTINIYVPAGVQIINISGNRISG